MGFGEERHQILIYLEVPIILIFHLKAVTGTLLLDLNNWFG